MRSPERMSKGYKGTCKGFHTRNEKDERDKQVQENISLLKDWKTEIKTGTYSLI